MEQQIPENNSIFKFIYLLQMVIGLAHQLLLKFIKKIPS